MKKWIAFMLSLILLFNFTGINAKAEQDIPDFLIDEEFDFESLDDPAFLQYLEDSIYAQLDNEFADSESAFLIDDVSAIYISKEYLEEIAYNTKANIFFGYNLAQINEVFQGNKYVFSLSDSGETIVQEFIEIPNDTYDRIVKNVLIGAGIILICVTVTVLTAGAAAPAASAGGASVASLAAAGTASTAAKVHMIFTAASYSAATMATKSAVFAGATTLVARGFETGWDIDAMTESAALASSEAFKWSAITGATLGGASEALRIHKINRGALSPREAEQAAQKLYGGKEQISYLNGEEVSQWTPGAVRPDIIVGNEAIEVKCYDLTRGSHLINLKRSLITEITNRITNLPSGMTQRIVLNVEGRGYTTTFVQNVVDWIHEFMEPIYPNIPIDVMGGML